MSKTIKTECNPGTQPGKRIERGWQSVKMPNSVPKQPARPSGDGGKSKG